MKQNLEIVPSLVDIVKDHGLLKVSVAKAELNITGLGMLFSPSTRKHSLQALAAFI